MVKPTRTAAFDVHVHGAGTPRFAPRAACSRFARDEDGALIIFGIIIFSLMMAIGGLSFDLMRYEAERARLQATTDRAALAAASLTQSLDPTSVVYDYFAKANMSEFLDNVVVDQGFNYRRVDVEANLTVPLHFGSFSAFATTPGESGADELVVTARSTAMEAIGNVEISMVLDVSGSMNSYNRLANMRNAAKDFVDTIYTAAEEGAVSTSIIPYATQVSAGPALLQNYTLGAGAHDRSYCVNFSANDFNNAALSTATELQQTLHFDPWTSRGWSRGSPLPNPVCPTDSSREITAWSQDPVALKSAISALTATGNTSTDIGLKWGAAMLDPGSKPVVNNMIATGDVGATLSGRPFNYTDDDTMKIIVVMTDGVNTSQYYMKDAYRSGITDYWIDPSDNRVSIWNGNGAEPQASNDWDLTSNNFYWTYPRDWDDQPDGYGNAVRLTWPDLWAQVPMRIHAKQNVYPMYYSYSMRNEIYNADTSVSGSAKNARMQNICTAAKNQGVIIFSVGLEVSDSSAARLESCASSPAHFFRVEGLDISYAFQSIASQINQLRLVQ